MNLARVFADVSFITNKWRGLKAVRKSLRPPVGKTPKQKLVAAYL